MIRFDSDYMQGAHPKILEELCRINMEKKTSYGRDEHCDHARSMIRSLCEKPEAEVFFLSGGTQANAAVISALLRTYEGVVATQYGHICSHEAGAIEATGHKVISLPSADGKLSATALDAYMRGFFEDENCEHLVRPGMVYLSHPTEWGTVYTKEELKKLKQVCEKYSLPLYVDGARLGYGLMARKTDVTLKDIAKYCDAFYIGGTKVGGLFGEAVVLVNTRRFAHFFTHIKNRGALLAKGWLIGVQFEALLRDNLYFEIARNAVDRAMEMREVLRQKGYELYIDSPTNQQFVVLEDRQLEMMKDRLGYSFWEKTQDGRTIIRLATSWASTREEIFELSKIL